MLRYLMRKLGLGIGVLLCTSAIAFFLSFLVGDPASRLAGESASAQEIAQVREQYGFDQPLPTQYARWLANGLAGEFGDSLFLKIPVTKVIAQHLPVTLYLASASILFSLIFGLAMGAIAAIREGGAVDRLCLFLSLVAQATPVFWFALIIMALFSFGWPILPSSGADSWKSFVLPTLALGFNAMPAIIRLTRTSLIEVLKTDYIRTARAKGIPYRRVVLKHALTNALNPVVSVSVVQFGYMLTGSIVVEMIFALHGVGQLAWSSIERGDIPIIQAIILLFSLIYVLLGILSDIVAAWLDPKLRTASHV